MTRRGPARRGLARLNAALARCGPLRPDPARPGLVRPGLAWFARTPPGRSRLSRCGVSDFGAAERRGQRVW
ncbi:hypothetical protein [Amycolatopsis plumensis]|uniref:hypothetical protein n=1 Tax=Amycolatopsis plumensis TaxID=236508 RepID=UPI0036144A86